MLEPKIREWVLGYVHTMFRAKRCITLQRVAAVFEQRRSTHRWWNSLISAARLL